MFQFIIMCPGYKLLLGFTIIPNYESLKYIANSFVILYSAISIVIISNALKDFSPCQAILYTSCLCFIYACIYYYFSNSSFNYTSFDSIFELSSSFLTSSFSLKSTSAPTGLIFIYSYIISSLYTGFYSYSSCSSVLIDLISSLFEKSSLSPY